MTPADRLNLARCAAARAHLYGGQAADLTAHMRTFGMPSVQLFNVPEYVTTLRARDAARRRYWQEMATSEALLGRPWAEADALGGRDD